MKKYENHTNTNLYANVKSEARTSLAPSSCFLEKKSVLICCPIAGWKQQQTDSISFDSSTFSNKHVCCASKIPSTKNKNATSFNSYANFCLLLLIFLSLFTFFFLLRSNLLTFFFLGAPTLGNWPDAKARHGIFFLPPGLKGGGWADWKEKSRRGKWVCVD